MLQDESHSMSLGSDEDSVKVVPVQSLQPVPVQSLQPVPVQSLQPVQV